MRNAREDLAGNVPGKFSPADWSKILVTAQEKVLASSLPRQEAWIEVIRDFNRNRYWGFVPNYKKPKVPRHEQNLGKRFIWYSFRSFLITKVAVLYFGARYTIDLDPMYGWLFFGAIAFMLTNYGLFLYRYGGRPEK
jgi:hypothetical protein